MMMFPMLYHRASGSPPKVLLALLTALQVGRGRNGLPRCYSVATWPWAPCSPTLSVQTPWPSSSGWVVNTSEIFIEKASKTSKYRHSQPCLVCFVSCFCLRLVGCALQVLNAAGSRWHWAVFALSVRPDACSLGATMRACAKGGRWEVAEALLGELGERSPVFTT